MKNLFLYTKYALVMVCLTVAIGLRSQDLFPAKGAIDVNVDTKLKLTFNEPIERGSEGWIRVFNNSTGAVVDSIDISIPDGPTQGRTYAPECHYAYIPYDYARIDMPTNRTVPPGTPSGEAEPTPPEYQLNIIGGFTDAFHFHPLTVKGHEASITLHNNMLDYGTTYTVTIDPGVIKSKNFKGITQGWTFTTKAHAPERCDTLRVNADGSADFSTVQGALDFIPDFSPTPTVILVSAGDYEEIVYARNKTNLIIVGEGIEKTRMHYPNNEVFNPHPLTVKTNEWPGTFPSRRAAFMLDNCHDVVLRDICVATDLVGQAEGLLLNGERIGLYRVHIIGSGDALQANGTIYMEDCELDGGGDTILGRGTVFAKQCNFRNDGGAFTWVRNTQGYHGDVFVDCTFSCPDDRECDFGRTPHNKGTDYPYAEMVLINCATHNVMPSGWSVLGEHTVTMLEYNTTDMVTGQPVHTSKRHPYSRQLTLPEDSVIIQCYSNPAFVLRGWHPQEK